MNIPMTRNARVLCVVAFAVLCAVVGGAVAAWIGASALKIASCAFTGLMVGLFLAIPISLDLWPRADEEGEARAALLKEVEANTKAEVVGLVETELGSCTIYKVTTTDGQVVLMTQGRDCRIAHVEPARSY